MHTSDQLGPLGLSYRYASVRMRVLPPFNRRKAQNQNRKNCTLPNSPVHTPPPHFLTTFKKRNLMESPWRRGRERQHRLSSEVTITWGASVSPGLCSNRPLAAALPQPACCLAHRCATFALPHPPCPPPP